MILVHMPMLKLFIQQLSKVKHHNQMQTVGVDLEVFGLIPLQMVLVLVVALV